MENNIISKRPQLLPNQEIGIISTYFTEQMLQRNFKVIRLKPETYVEEVLERHIEVVFIDSYIYEIDHPWFAYDIEDIISLFEKLDINIVIVNNDSRNSFLRGDYFYINIDSKTKEPIIENNHLHLPIIANEKMFNPINDKPSLDILYFKLGTLKRGKYIQKLHTQVKPLRKEIVTDHITRRIVQELVKTIKKAKVLYIYYSEELPDTLVHYIEVLAALQNTKVILDSNYKLESNLSINTRDDESNIELVNAFHRDGIYREKNNIENHRIAFLKNTLIQYNDFSEILSGRINKEDIRVSVVTSTKRKWTLKDYVERLNNQANVQLQVVLVTHGFIMDQSEIRALQEQANFSLTIISKPSSLSFGLCLNEAISLATEKYFTKIDDDDYYYSNYLIDSWIASKYTDANIIGKHSQFVYLEETEMVIQRFSNAQYRYSEYVAGATIFCETSFINKYLFSDLRKAVDSDLLRRVREDGGRLYCTHPYEFCIFRAGDKSEHTWQIDDTRLLKSAKIHFIGNPHLTIQV
ncbi:hypothetical protein [Aliicoccus persicus]|uniref:Glycosyl transferase family 2 n=1 Tax=Aliicoccus persicus TaxID=930138 RepID=A0A662Z278_9STAP|nr:hypothetical protein [Aliicoccus persicus]SEV79642.1 hypothetical protein SAMN05192557_0009 [Aliicoccus persicus]